MKKSAPSVYGNLSPNQRVIACIEALARGDEGERRRLIDSCPKVTCRQTDPHFTQKMEDLMDLAMAVEADLKECALRFFVAIRLDPKNANGHLQEIANIRQAWRMTLESMGIEKGSMALAGPPPSPVFGLIEGLLPKPKKKRSEELSVEMLDIMG